MFGRASRISAGVSFLLTSLVILGCSPSPGPSPSRPDSLVKMRAAASNGSWDRAFVVSNDVLLQHPGNADVMAEVARVAFFAEKPELAAELLCDACKAQSYQNESRGLQAVVALIGVGRLYDGIEMLEQAVAAQPKHFELRRWLFDFYIGTEDRLAAYPHAEYLIRQRKFDADLLVSLANMSRRAFDWKPLDKMVERNPDDQRPWLGRAKKLFDRGKYDESLTLLDRILSRHSESLVTIALKARVLAASGQFEMVSNLASESIDGVKRYPDYWIAMGDLARSNEQHATAARSYWEAARRDPNVTEAWSKLANTLFAGENVSLATGEDIAAVSQRSKNLNQLDRLIERFDQLGRDSPEQAIEIAESLQGLGRPWEAEAWTAVAMTLKVPVSEQTKQGRNAIIAGMSLTTPWQLIAGQSAMQVDFSSLPLPSQSADTIVNHAERAGSNHLPSSVADAASVSIVLRDEAAQRGLAFFGTTRRAPETKSTMLHETLGCGGGVIDYDLDGWPDLYLLAAAGTPPQRDSAPNSLLRNLNGQFIESTREAAVGDTGFGQGLAVGDLNEDGFPDLLVLNFGLNKLYMNRGDGTFKDATELIGSNSDQQWSTSGAIADIDGDGISDAAILNYCQGADIATYVCWREQGITRSCTPLVYPADHDLFYRTSETGALVDQTSAWNAIAEVPGRGLGVVVGSFDDQPGIDLYVANDQTENHYWSVRKAGDSIRLMESGITRGLAGNDRSLAQGSMGIAVTDFNGDQQIDFYVTNFAGEYNTYYEQQSAGSWKDCTASKGLVAATLPMVGFGTAAVDLDHNGSPELMVTNGNVDIFVVDEVTNQATIQSQPAQLFQQDAQGDFQIIEMTADNGYMNRPHFGRALWTLDVNRDGRMDLGVTHQTEPVAILVNHTPATNHWIEIQLVGTSSARDAIGARISLHDNARPRTAWLTSGDGYLCSNERVIHLGLGMTEQPQDITITWPDGSNQFAKGLAINSRWLIVQGDTAFQLP